MEISKEEINLGLIVKKYEEELVKNLKKDAQHVLLQSSFTDLLTTVEVVGDTIERYPGTKYAKTSNYSVAEEQKPVDRNIMINLELDLIDDNSFSSYLERCLGCDGRISFELELNPDFPLMAEWKSMLDSISTQLDIFETALFEKKDLTKICDLIKLFQNIPCPQDIIILISSLKILIKKFAQSTISFKFDWFSLFSPIIQSMVNLLTESVDLLFSLINAPLNCSISSIQANLALIKAFDPGNIFSGISDDENSTISFLGLTNYKVSTKTYEELSDKQEEKQGAQVPIAINSNSSMSDIIKKDPKMFFNLSGAEKAVLAFNDAKQEIDDLKKKIESLIGNLNGLVRGNKLFEINSTLMIVYILDLIAFLTQLLKYNVKDLTSLCETNTEGLEAIIKSINADVTVNVQKVDNGYNIELVSTLDNSKVNINTCSTKNVAIEDLTNLLKNIEDLTNGI